MLYAIHKRGHCNVRFFLALLLFSLCFSFYSQGETWNTNGKNISESIVIPNLDITKNATIKAPATVTVNGNVNLNAKLTIEAGACLKISNGNFTISAYGEVASSGTVEVVGNMFVDNGKLNLSNTSNVTVVGDVEMSGSKAQEINGLFNILGGNLTIDGEDGSITFNLKGRVIVSDRVKRGDGSYQLKNNTGNFIIRATAKDHRVVLNYYSGGELYVYNNFEQKEESGNNGNNATNLIQSQQAGSLICVGGKYILPDKHKTNIVGGSANVYILGEDGIPNVDGLSTKVGDIDDFISEFGVSSISALLPIELTSFTATATESGYTFNWVTASEKENDYFTLEYSIDGVNFNEIDYVHGAGTTSETSEYEYRWDEAPDFEMIYFRLKQTDYNGEYSYSDVLVSSRKKSSGANGTFRYGPLNFKVVDGQLQYIVK